MLQQGILNIIFDWLDGPFGKIASLKDYEMVVLFASGSGVFAQLPLIKGLSEEFKISAIKKPRIKLVWETDRSYHQLKKWFEKILSDPA